MKLYTLEQIRQAIATAHGQYKSESELDELLDKTTSELEKLTPTPKQRVEVELAQLTDRLQRLEAFIGNYQPNQLDESLPIWRMSVDNRKWLLYQRQCMRDYKRALECRLKIWSDEL